VTEIDGGVRVGEKPALGNRRSSRRRLEERWRPGRGAKRRWERGELIPLLTLGRDDARTEIDGVVERERSTTTDGETGLGQLYGHNDGDTRRQSDREARGAGGD
jgi:hypothetical protein